MADSKAEAAAILALDDRRLRATVAADLATLDELMAAEAIYTHSSGLRDTKAEYLAALKSGKFKYSAIARPEARVTVWPDAAVIVGRMEIDVAIDGAAKHVSSVFTSAWRRAGGKWQMVALQSGSAPAQK